MGGNDDRIHVEIFSQIAALKQQVERQHPQQPIIIINLFLGGSMDFTRVNTALAKNTSIGEVFGTIFDEIAQAIRDAKGNQSQLDELATKLEDDNVREEMRVNALKDLVTPTAPALAAAWNGPASGTVGESFSGAVAASGGTAPYTFSQDSGGNEGGKLPDGLTFSADGTVSGTLTTAGEFSFGGSVNDAAGGTARWTAAISVS